MDTNMLAIFANTNTDCSLMEAMIMHLDRREGRMPLVLKDERLPALIRVSPAVCGQHLCVMLHEAPNWEFAGDSWEVIAEL